MFDISIAIKRPRNNNLHIKKVRIVQFYLIPLKIKDRSGWGECKSFEKILSGDWQIRSNLKYIEICDKPQSINSYIILIKLFTYFY